MSLEFSCFETEWGWVGIMGSDKGLYKSTLPAPHEKSAIDAIIDNVIAERRESKFKDIKGALISYFSGERIEFDFPVDLSNCTDFQRRVWLATARIPYGDLYPYGWIAEQIGNPKSSRTVGQSLGANRLPIIIPCHRVIRSDGGLGGFSGGLHWKKRLIELENAKNILT
jgi:methylated-DNA-[protein]-cysteine S-methyltransferase